MPGRRRTADSAERARLIVDLRRRRVPLSEIADQLGITPARVSQIYTQTLREIPAQSVAEHRAEEVQLADDAAAALMVIARDDGISPRTRVEAWNSLRGWSEHKSRILGINAPVKLEVDHSVDADIERFVAELAGLAPGGEAAVAGPPGGGGGEAPSA
jgi:predicted transcriptional regulator